MEGADFALVQHRESVREIFDATQIAQRQSEVRGKRLLQALCDRVHRQ